MSGGERRYFFFENEKRRGVLLTGTGAKNHRSKLVGAVSAIFLPPTHATPSASASVVLSINSTSIFLPGTINIIIL